MPTNRRTSSWFSLGILLFSTAATKADVVDFVAELTAACAGTTSTSSGSGKFSLNTQTGLFKWDIVYTDFNSPSAAIRGPITPACGSMGGGAILVQLVETTDYRMHSSTVFDETQRQQVLDGLLDGLYYVNIPTPEFMNGEIAGVIVRAPEVDKCRHISFVPGHSGENTAIRVNLTSLHHVNPPYNGGPSVPFTSFEGEVRWVGQPVQYIESTASGATYSSSVLQCTPHYQDWGSVLRLDVSGSAIVPSSIYDVEVLAESCMGNEAFCGAILDSYTIKTTRWSDVEALYNPPSATGQPDIADVYAMVNKFRNRVDAPTKARVLIAGNDAFGNFSVPTLSNDFDFTHIAVCVDAFRGKSYPYMIQACP